MKMGKLLLGFEVILTSITFSQTYIPPGDVSGIWSLGSSPYFVQGYITIPNDSTLIIEPGVLVEFQGHYSLNVQGCLLAIGTETNKIIFTVNDTTGIHNPDITQGGWNGIQFIDTPTENDTSKIICCILQYGKAVGSSPPDNSGGAIFISNFDKVLISNSIISHNSAGGTGSPSGGGLGLHFADINLSDNEISHNRAINGGAANFNECDIQINNCEISDNSSAWIGGGITAYSCNLEINNTSFERDTAFIFGGAMGIYNSDLTINNSHLMDNSSRILGGGIHSDYSSINLSNTTFERDTSGDSGGAIFTLQCQLNVSDCIFFQNSATYSGGAISMDSTLSVFSNNTFQHNRAVSGGAVALYRSDSQLNINNIKWNTADHGGAFMCELSNLQFKNISFEGNSSFWGGAISSNNCSLQIDSCVFKQNSAENQGGALEYIADTTGFISICQLEITNSKFEENSASTRCGVALIEQYNSSQPLAHLMIDNCEFINNNALRIGAFRVGSISSFTLSNSKFIGNTVTQYTAACTFVQNSNGYVYNCLFADNIANGGTSGGAGISNNSKVDFMNCSFVNNRSGSGGGIQIRVGSIVTLTNCILWGNYPDQISLLALTDTTACSLYSIYNDIEYGVDSIHINDTISVVNWGIGNMDSDPLFVDTLNGDFHLKDFSPCIAAGIDSIEVGGFWQYSPSTDIQGNPRPNPAGTMPDMGAYESEFPTAIRDDDLIIPNKFALFQNYPNPFNPSTIISWQSPVGSWQTLKVYDVLGKEIATLVDEYKPAGIYEVELSIYSGEGRNLPSGIYFYQINSGEFVQTKKMVLIK